VSTSIPQLSASHASLPHPAVDASCLPRLDAIASRVASSLTIACVIPGTLLYFTMVWANVTAAVLIALAWTYGAITWRWATNRSPSGLLALSGVVMTLRTITVLMTGNTFVYFFQPILANVAVAALFFLSLLTDRSVAARLAPDFIPMSDQLADRPRVRRLCRQLTLFWAVICLVKGAVSWWLLESQSLTNFVMIKSITIISLTLLAVAVTVIAAVWVAGKEGLTGREAASSDTNG
jgi:hypothetical protein